MSHINRETSSKDCSSIAGEEDGDDVIFHPIDSAEPTSRWFGSDSAGISAWAADIPSGAPPGDVQSLDDQSSFYSFSNSTYRPLPPNLLKNPPRIVPPSLSMTTPPVAAPVPSTPVLTPRRQQSATSIAPSANTSMGQTSLTSAVTESSLATPASSNPVPIACVSQKPSVLEDMYVQVRSWVSPLPVPIASTQRPQPQVTPTDLPKATPKPLPSSSHPSHGFTNQSAVYWVPSTVLTNQQYATKRPRRYEPSRGRQLDVPLPHDDHPSFRTRGRRASRAAA